MAISKNYIKHLHNRPAFFTSCIAVTLLCLLAIFFGSPGTTQTSSSSSPLDIAGDNSSSPFNPPTSLDTASPLNCRDSVRPKDQQDLASCDLFDGRWVVDEDESSSPSYPPGTCPFIDDAFNCVKNGRKDTDYTKLRWQPNGCRLPRLDGKRMLEMMRGKRLAFVGDSLNRNMWESLVCILRNSVRFQDQVFEVSGRQNFKSDAFYAFNFIDYNCTIEFFRTPFLVQEMQSSDSEKKPRETLRLDLMDKASADYRSADVLIFNTAHWWTHTKTSQGKDYYQEGDHVYSLLSRLKAYRKAMSTWARWIDANIDPSRQLVFFRGYSSSHFNGGNWNGGGGCDGETLPITEEKYLSKYPMLMRVLEQVIEGMKTPIRFLNVTRMTDYRKDAHPSVFREAAARKKPGLQLQDCSHWCLPGVPDAWNQILYVMLLRDSAGEQGESSI